MLLQNAPGGQIKLHWIELQWSSETDPVSLDNCCVKQAYISCHKQAETQNRHWPTGILRYGSKSNAAVSVQRCRTVVPILRPVKRQQSSCYSKHNKPFISSLDEWGKGYSACSEENKYGIWTVYCIYGRFILTERDRIWTKPLEITKVINLFTYDQVL